MDARQTVLGIVLMLIFLAMQANWIALGPLNLLLGAIVFVAVIYLIGRGVMPKPSADMKEMWMFSSALLLALTVLALFAIPYLPGVVLPSDMAAFAALIMRLWLFIYGAAMFITGWSEKWHATTLVGIFWLFGAFDLSLSFVAQNGYLHFAFIVGIPLIIYGLMSKK